MLRLTTTLTGALTAALVLTLAASAQAQKAPALSADLALAGAGGASFKVPDWKEARKATDGVAILKEVADKGPAEGFTLLMMTIEAGPRGEGEIDWKAVLANMVKSAEKASSTLELSLKGDWAEAKDFRGQRMSGTIKTKDETLTVELVALVAKDKLVTVSALTPKADVDAVALVEAVAKTAALGK